MLGRGGSGYGIATGARSGYFVLDIDGAEAVDRLAAMGPIPRTFTVGRGDANAHLCFAQPNFQVKTSAGQLGKGLDIRGDGGFVVAPGSPHKSGAKYEVIDDSPIAQAPAWLLAWPGLRRTLPSTTEPSAYGPIEPVPIRDPESRYALGRFVQAVQYLERAPLVCFETKGHGRRDVMFRICVVLTRTMRFSLDCAADLIEQAYNPRLVAVGVVPWSRSEPGDYGMCINERLQCALATGHVPAGDVMDEATWQLWHRFEEV
jgi:hypothetical protein